MWLCPCVQNPSSICIYAEPLVPVRQACAKYNIRHEPCCGCFCKKTTSWSLAEFSSKYHGRRIVEIKVMMLLCVYVRSEQDSPEHVDRFKKNERSEDEAVARLYRVGACVSHHTVCFFILFRICCVCWWKPAHSVLMFWSWRIIAKSASRLDGREARLDYSPQHLCHFDMILPWSYASMHYALLGLETCMACRL